jgi:hypothetical protein
MTNKTERAMLMKTSETQLMSPHDRAGWRHSRTTTIPTIL